MSGMSAAASAAPLYQISPPMVQSSSTSTVTSTASSSVAYLNETIAKASALPESFYPEFLQYSKESFEQNHQRRNNASTNSKKRTRQQDDDDDEKPQLSSSSSTSSEDEADERPARKQAKVEYVFFFLHVKFLLLGCTGEKKEVYETFTRKGGDREGGVYTDRLIRNIWINVNLLFTLFSGQKIPPP
jgi:hypothetical protein